MKYEVLINGKAWNYDYNKSPSDNERALLEKIGTDIALFNYTWDARTIILNLPDSADYIEIVAGIMAISNKYKKPHTAVSRPPFNANAIHK